MDLIRVHQIQLMWKEDHVWARLGIGDRQYPAGSGSTLPEALRDLANMLERSGVKVWVPRPAKPYTEDGVQKIACPECGAVHVSEFDHVIAFVCDSCGMGVDVEN